jgi:hypothetical protein
MPLRGLWLRLGACGAQARAPHPSGSGRAQKPRTSLTKPGRAHRALTRQAPAPLSVALGRLSSRSRARAGRREARAGRREARAAQLSTHLPPPALLAAAPHHALTHQMQRRSRQQTTPGQQAGSCVAVLTHVPCHVCTAARGAASCSCRGTTGTTLHRPPCLLRCARQTARVWASGRGLSCV